VVVKEQKGKKGRGRNIRRRQPLAGTSVQLPIV